MLPTTSEDSVLSPFAEAVIFNSICVPSTLSTDTVESLPARRSSDLSSVVLAVLVCPSLSVDAAVTLRVKFVSLAALIVRVERFQPMMSTDVEPDLRGEAVSAVAQRRPDRAVADKERA